MKKPVTRNLLITVGSSLGLGILGIVPVVNSENGYVAGFVYFPLLLLLGVACLILFIVGFALIFLQKNVGIYFLLAMILLPVGFFGSAHVAKHFEMGAYREEPMVPIIPVVSNVVLFKKDATAAQIEDFWNETLSTKREDDRGYDHLPGLRGTMRLLPHNGYEVAAFEFFDNATEEQRQYVYSRVRESPIVFKLLESVPTKDYMNTMDVPSNDNRPKKEMRIERLTSNNNGS